MRLPVRRGDEVADSWRNRHFEVGRVDEGIRQVHCFVPPDGGRSAAGADMKRTALSGVVPRSPLCSSAISTDNSAGPTRGDDEDAAPDETSARKDPAVLD